MLALGIDPGTATTGYGLVEQDDDSLRLIACGVISTPAGVPLPERLLAIHRQLSDLIRTYHPETAAVEELFFSKNVRTAMSVGHARGVILLAVAQAGLPIYEYKPSEVKLAVAGYGAATKGQMQEMVRLLLDLDKAPAPDDAADAVAIAVCHLHSAHSKYLEEDA